MADERDDTAWAAGRGSQARSRDGEEGGQSYQSRMLVAPPCARRACNAVAVTATSVSSCQFYSFGGFGRFGVRFRPKPNLC